MLIIDLEQRCQASLRSMVGFTDGGCACRTAGDPGELKGDNVRGGGMGGVIQPKNNHAEESGDIVEVLEVTLNGG